MNPVFVQFLFLFQVLTEPIQLAHVLVVVDLVVKVNAVHLKKHVAGQQTITTGLMLGADPFHLSR
jgi:hypothetical protein